MTVDEQLEAFHFLLEKTLMAVSLLRGSEMAIPLKSLRH